MNLCIDIGNTRTKIGLFAGTALTAYWTVSTNDLGETLKKTAIKAATKAIFSTVATHEHSWLARLESIMPVMFLDTETPLPFQNRYATPHTLGKDRLAAVAGAQALYPHQHCLVIDLGTCIKYEILTADGEFLGGNIAPGARMRIQAMHQFTARLPEVPMTRPTEPIGSSTETALQNGALLGAVLEIQGFIHLIEATYPGIRVILSGGDAAFFYEMPEFKNLTFEPELTLHGLNQILNYNS